MEGNTRHVTSSRKGDGKGPVNRKPERYTSCDDEARATHATAREVFKSVTTSGAGRRGVGTAIGEEIEARSESGKHSRSAWIVDGLSINRQQQHHQ